MSATSNPNTIGLLTEPPPKELPIDPNYKVQPPWTLDTAKSARSNYDEEAKDTIGDLPRASARASARSSARPSARPSARGSARTTGTSARPLDSVRTDMSTGRLEANMASLLAEKSVLMRRLNAVEKELRADGKKNEPSKQASRRRH